MKVYIENTIWYGEDKLLERYPDLDEFGYGEEEVLIQLPYPREIVLDENGNEMITYRQKVKKKPYIIMESLEDLVKLRRAVQNPLIFDKDDDVNYTIEIYDGHRE